MTNHIHTIGTSGNASSASCNLNELIQEWIEEMLEDCKVVSIISSSTIVSDKQWLMTIIYQYSTIVKREILVERIVKEIEPEVETEENNNEAVYEAIVEYGIYDDDWAI